MDALTQQLAQFSSSFSETGLDAALLAAVKEHLVDSIGCAIAAYDCQPAKIGLSLSVPTPLPGQQGLILLHNRTTALDTAAFVNSCMIRNLDFSDRFPGGHPSDCLGALLALAFARNMSGRQLLTGMTVTYEIFARLSEAALLSRRGWDQGFVVGLSTVGGLSNLLGLSYETTANAIGMYASTGVPFRVTRAGELTQWKNVATSYAVRNAVFLTLLAAEGLEGPARAFEGRNGLFENITGAFAITAFPGHGGTAMTPQVQLKYWPVETNGQPVIWAALDLRARVRLDDLVSIEVLTNKFTVYEIGSEPQKWDPQTRETADHSLPYMFARALVDGPLTEASFSLDAVRDAKLRPIMNMIKVSVDPAIDALPSGQVEMRVVATLRDGTSVDIRVGNPLGHPDAPMNERDISDKFRRQSEPVLGAAATDRVLQQLWRIDTAETLSSLAEMLHVRS